MTRPPLENRPLALDGPSGRAVLLVHGLGGGPYEVQRLGEALHARHGLTVRAPHLPGHEGPGPWMPASAWPAWSAALERARDELAARHARVDLVGFSTGCPLVLHLAATRATDARVVLLAPFVRVFRPRFVPVAPEALLGWLPFVRAVPRRPPPLRDRAARREVARCSAFRTFNTDAVRSALELIATAMGELDRVRGPVLVVQGLRDSVVDPKGAAEIVARLGARARLVDVADSDHLLTLDAEGARVIDEACAFLDAPS